eukprot:scaffold1518_cov417-Prasinococcus_capsulatus_cf.AAC.19
MEWNSCQRPHVYPGHADQSDSSVVASAFLPPDSILCVAWPQRITLSSHTTARHTSNAIDFTHCAYLTRPLLHEFARDGSTFTPCPFDHLRNAQAAFSASIYRTSTAHVGTSHQGQSPVTRRAACSTTLWHT